jgi:acyl-CoA thioesterase
VDDNGTLSDAEITRIRQAINRVPFATLLGIELEQAERGSATLRLNIRDELRQIHGLMHGGAIASLIDTATAFAIVTLLEDEEKFSTVDLMVNYLRPLKEGTATATARVLRAGRRLITVSADVFDDGGNLAATALSTYLKLA